jgi:hypothetical protein
MNLNENLSEVDQYRTLVSKGKNEYLSVLKSFNWFEQKEEENKQKIIYSIEKELDENYLFLALKDLHFDTEGFESADSYKWLTSQLIGIAGLQNEFNSIDIVEQDNVIRITIHTNKNKEFSYFIDLNIHEDWLDEKFIQHFFNEVLLPELTRDKRFHQLPVTDQSMDLFFINQKEFDQARLLGLIPNEDVFFD